MNISRITTLTLYFCYKASLWLDFRLEVVAVVDHHQPPTPLEDQQQPTTTQSILYSRLSPSGQRGLIKYLAGRHSDTLMNVLTHYN